MQKDIKIQIRKQKRAGHPKKEKKRKQANSSKTQHDLTERILRYIDKHQYKINQIMAPVVEGTIVAGAGIKAFDYVVDKIPMINENIAIIGKPGGKALIAGLGALILYEAGKDILLGTKKSRLPGINKIPFDGIWKISNKKNKELYEKDKKNQVSRFRKNCGYAKNLGLGVLIGGVILTGAAKNTADNLRFNLSELLYQKKGVAQLDQKQTRTLDNMLDFNLGKAIDSQIKKSMIEAELYRMTDTRWERKKAWQVKNKIRKYESTIKKQAKRNGIDPHLIEGIIFVESKGNKNAVSKAGAKGLMQLMDITTDQYNVENPFDPKQNIRGGAHKYKDLLDQCEGNVPLALTLYNCRKDAVDWAIRKSGSNDPFVFVHWLQKEPREYAVKVLAATAYMINGENPAKTENASAKAQNIGSEFRYIRKNSKGKDVFEYNVKSGDWPVQIAKKFNSEDLKNGDKYKEIVYKTGVVNKKGYFVGNDIKPNQIVYIVADRK
ncbi:transglycosylase SLT domain-containing protein [Candidatus Woesearchaeota archaeon]|nr:transglycosylase SLT domain-containing protein [Candidatus Woesearchaeota archaeon]